MQTLRAKQGTVRLFMPATKATPAIGRVPAQPALLEARPTVTANVVAGIALHRKTDRDGNATRPARWALTHVASGSLVTSLVPQGRARDGKSSRAEYLSFLKFLCVLETYRAWAKIMNTAPFGTISPSTMGGRCVDLSRCLAEEARGLAHLFGGVA